MKKENILIKNIPAVIWGNRSDRVYLYVHGKMGSKEAAEGFAAIAEEMGYQTFSFDLPGHGERAADNERCDIWNGIRDLQAAAEYISDGWREIDLFACSLGAYFSLNAYRDFNLNKCLFQSPIVNMEYLIGQMMKWFDISEERLRREQEIETPIDLMTWKYYRYVKTHPIKEWKFPTSILYGGRDNLQSAEVINEFAEKFGCRVTTAPECEHPFMAEGDEILVEKWLRENI